MKYGPKSPNEAPDFPARRRFSHRDYAPPSVLKRKYRRNSKYSPGCGKR